LGLAKSTDGLTIPFKCGKHISRNFCLLATYVEVAGVVELSAAQQECFKEVTMLGSVRNAFIGTVAFGVMVGSPTVVQAADYTLDPYHSKAEFSVRHMMISNVSGEFAKVTGTAQYDGKDVKSIKVDATIDANSIDTGNEDRDKHLRNKDFFDTEKYPTIKFVSKSAKPAGKGQFKLTGDLTMHGVTKPVTLDVEGPTPEINDKHGNMKLGAEAKTVINRKDFGISYGGLMDNGGAAVSDEVKITLNIELARPAEKKAEGSDKKTEGAEKKAQATK